MKPILLFLTFLALHLPAFAEQDDAAIVRQRYRQFLVGGQDTFSGELGAGAAREFLKRIEGPVREALRFDMTRDPDLPFRSFEEDPQYSRDYAVFSPLLERHLLSLAYAYSVEAPGSPHFGNPLIRQRYLECLDYLHRRGIRAGMTFHNNAARMAMKGAPQPPPGAANLPRMELRMGALCQSVLLMEPAIGETETFQHARQLVRHLELLGFTSGHVRYYERDSNPPGYENLVQSDAIQNFTDTTLVSALLEADRARCEELLLTSKRVLTDSLKVTPGWEDTIKPDFTGFHHRGIYGNYYTCGFIPQAALGVHLLRGTRYAVDQASVQNLKELVKTCRLYSQKYNPPFGIRGRMPTGADTLRDQVFSGIIILASNLGLGDPEMKPVFARLWDREVVGLDFLYAGGRGKLFRGMGTLDMLADLEREAPKPEPDPNGFFSKPYGGLTLHRREHWMASIKGYSRYVWDYENGPPGENLYGEHLSHGSLFIFSKGSPVNDLASGYDLQHGWDWNRIPGTTAVHAPIEPRKPLDHRRFSSESFLGSASAEGRDGVFGMILHEEKDTAGKTLDLRARKSAFFIDHFILLLGSGIGGGDGVHPVETTLFQSVLRDREDYHLDPAELRDPANNRYFLKDPSLLKFQQGPQSSYLQDGKTPSKGNVAVAWLDHGVSPGNAGYEFGIGIDGAEPKRYEVLRADSKMHAVRFPEDRWTAQVFFEAGPAETKNTAVTSADTPCLVVTRETETGILLGVTNPDLAFVDPGVKVDFRYLDQDHHSWLPSRPRPVELTLAGSWSIKAPSREVTLVSADASITRLRFHCHHGIDRRIELVRGAR